MLKIFDYQCSICGAIHEEWTEYKRSLVLDCPHCNKPTDHTICVGGTGYRWVYCDDNGSEKHFIGDP